MNIPTIERFMRHVLPEPTSGCWLWAGTEQCRGYGQIEINNKSWLAHRWSWVWHRGKIPKGLNVLHKCDTPCCVNPDHLFLGTQQANMNDMASKGRRSRKTGGRGDRNGHASLSHQDVIAIRADNRTGVVIAAEYGVSPGAISFVKRRKTWSHIP